MTEPFGSLNTAGGKLPLQAMDIRTHITGLLYSTTVRQTYFNQHQQPLEATYIFPLPSRAAVSGYVLTVGDVITEAVLKSRTEAHQAYETGIRTGRRAALAEQERPDVFSVRVGNIAPGEIVQVELRLEGPLALEGSEAVFRFPLVVGPRYVPGQPLEGAQAGPGVQLDSTQVPDASRISPPVLLPGHPNPVQLSLTVDVNPAGLAWSKLECSLHEVSISRREPESYRVVLGPAERLDRDFVLRLRLQPCTRLLVGPDRSFLLMVVPPPSPAQQPGRDLVLMLDTSGSMEGWKMLAARRAAAEIVENLAPRDRFALVTFSTFPVDGPFARMEPAYDEIKSKSASHLRRLQAGGGTEMLAAFRHAERHLSGPHPTLLLITDGEVGDHDALVQWIQQRPQLRMFVIGIDESPSYGLLDRLATGSGGFCRVVESEQKLTEALHELHRAIGQPVLQELELLPPALARSPQRWDVFPEHPALFWGELPPAANELQLRGMLPDGTPWQQPLEPVQVDTAVVSRAYARARILDLEDEWSRSGQNEEQIVQLSLKHQVLSRFTAYVAVESRTQEVTGPLHRVVQPGENLQERRASGPAKKPESVVQLMQVDPISLEVGRGLLQLVDPNHGAQLLEAVTDIRRQIALELGIIVPGVRFRDNLQLKPCEYVIKIKEIEVFSAIVDPHRPEAVAVVSAQLVRIIRTHAADLLGRQEVQALVDTLKKRNSQIVRKVIPDRYSLGEVQKVLQQLVQEHVSIAPLERIVQALLDIDPATVDLLTPVRLALSDMIVRPLLRDGKLAALLLPRNATEMPEALEVAGGASAIVAPACLRRQVRQQIAKEHPDLPVLSYEEVEPHAELVSAAPSLPV
jgi:Ca-activated chloride channel homolog